jgi:hypothetical protein
MSLDWCGLYGINSRETCMNELERHGVTIFNGYMVAIAQEVTMKTPFT